MFEQYIVIADYKKQSKNDINLKAGDIVDAIERNENGESVSPFTALSSICKFKLE